VGATDLLELVALELGQDSLEGGALGASQEVDEVVLACGAGALELEGVAEAPKALDGEGAKGGAFIGVRHGLDV
jgi:hypothetical protein